MLIQIFFLSSIGFQLKRLQTNLSFQQKQIPERLRSLPSQLDIERSFVNEQKEKSNQNQRNHKHAQDDGQSFWEAKVQVWQHSLHYVRTVRSEDKCLVQRRD